MVILLLIALLLVPIDAAAQAAAAPAAPSLTREEMREFLLKAKIIRSRSTSIGVTAPRRLTLTKGAIIHDAAFQSVDEHDMVANLQGKKGSSVELNFVDHYRYNLAAYAMSGLLGLDHMMPVHVRRRYDGKDGALSWWVETLMDEGERLKKKVQPPSATDWNNQMYRMRLFGALVRDTDRNLGNVLITPEWKIVMIDFTRAFRLQSELLYSNDLPKIDRALLPKLDALSKESIKAAVRDDLTNSEIDAVLKRRDLLVAHFRKLIAEQGEAKVLY